MTQPARYLEPKGPTAVGNAIVSGLAKLGVSLAGSRVLAVRGRVSGEWRETPVNLLPYGGERYLLAPRGHTQWVRNLRVAGEGTLRVGRRLEPFAAVELSDEEKVPLMREYLRRWAWEVGAFFENLNVKSPDEDLAAAAPGFPVFRIAPASSVQ